jgi:hypothetical protein
MSSEIKVDDSKIYDFIEELSQYLFNHYNGKYEHNIQKLENSRRLMFTNIYIYAAITKIASEQDIFKSILVNSDIEVTMFAGFKNFIDKMFNMFQHLAKKMTTITIIEKDHKAMTMWKDFFHIIGKFKILYFIISKTTEIAESVKIKNKDTSIHELYNTINQKYFPSLNSMKTFPGKANAHVAEINVKVKNMIPTLQDDVLLNMFTTVNRHGKNTKCRDITDKGLNSLYFPENQHEIAGNDIKDPVHMIMTCDSRRIKCAYPMGADNQNPYAWFFEMIKHAEVTLEVSNEDKNIVTSFKCFNNPRELKKSQEEKDVCISSSSSSSSSSIDSEKKEKDNHTDNCCNKVIKLNPSSFLKTRHMYITGKKPVLPNKEQEDAYIREYIKFVKTKIHTCIKNSQMLSSIGEKVVFCPRANCSGSFGFATKDTLNTKCILCKTTFCTMCNVIGKHDKDGKNCSKVLEQRMMEFEGLDVHICKECGTAIHKEGGCDKVICEKCKWACCWVCKFDTLIQKKDIEQIIQEYKLNGITLDFGGIDFRYTHENDSCKSVTHGGEYGFIWKTLDYTLSLMRDTLEQTGTSDNIITEVISKIRIIAETRQTITSI